MKNSIDNIKDVGTLSGKEGGPLQGDNGIGTDSAAIDNHRIFSSVDKQGHATYYIPLDWVFAGGTSKATSAEPEPEDTASIQIKVKIDRPLEQSEQKDLDDLKKAIIRVTHGLDKMPDNHILTMDDGGTVNGRELKQLWSKTDFVINEKEHQYGNGFRTGEANRNNGNPIISFNIDIIEKYKGVGAGGENHLVLHELSHMTEAGNSFYAELARSGGEYTKDEFNQNERYANDIARAIAHHCDIPTLSEDEAKKVKEYSPGGVKQFVSPTQRRKDMATAFRTQSSEDATRKYPELKPACDAFDAVEAAAGRTRMHPQERAQLLATVQKRLAHKIEHDLPIPSPRNAVRDAGRILANAREDREY